MLEKLFLIYYYIHLNGHIAQSFSVLERTN